MVDKPKPIAKTPEIPKIVLTESGKLKTPEIPKMGSSETGKAKSTLQIPKFDALKSGLKTEAQAAPKVEEREDQPVTPDQIRTVWKEFAESRKI